MGHGLVPAWCDIRYGGAEQFWREGWTWPKQWATDLEYSDYDFGRPRQWDFLVCDPDDLEASEENLKKPPILSVSNSQTTQIPPPTCKIFARLPVEIIAAILDLLPTTSVKALRHSSRFVAFCGLSSNFWKLRFVYPDEVCHIPL
jgi:F-box domain